MDRSLLMSAIFGDFLIPKMMNMGGSEATTSYPGSSSLKSASFLGGHASKKGRQLLAI